ncbi:MAG TPA: carbohydrate-binding domain-containing protein [Thermomicrobiales bacterium]|nr:carbohydrate-binding domain-containing protein [Thermomicrobiales bacterium]
MYRNEDVDIRACTDAASSSPCYNVGCTEPGEWLAFDVDVPVPGNYTFTFRYASPATSARSVRVETDGVDVSGAIVLAPTGGYQVWADGSSGPLAIAAGNHTIKILIESSGLNLNNIGETGS